MAETPIDFRTEPSRYKHWKLALENGVAYLTMDVNEDGGLRPGYKLKLNSYDLGVGIELADAVQRLRFEHPEVGAVVIRSLRDRIFCSGANINMLGLSTHDHKVNFCKFTNETRLAIEDASEHSDQTYICSINGIAAGGGYELALACDQILLADDGSSAVSLPELPWLAVLPGPGGLTLLVDNRRVRRDHADFFCTTAEGMRGKRAQQWRLVDRLIPPSKLADETKKIAEEAAANSKRPKGAKGIALPDLERALDGDTFRYPHLTVEIDRERRAAHFRVNGPSSTAPADAAAVHAQGAAFWPLALARALDDAMMHLRLNETEIGTWVLHSQGDSALVETYDALLARESSNWLVREIVLYWKRTLKRLDVSSRSLIALVEPGSCFAGTLFELVLAADRSYMLDGVFEGSNLPAAAIKLTDMNFGPYPMGNGLTRLGTRFLSEPRHVDDLKEEIGEAIEAEAADQLGLVTFTPDDIDYTQRIPNNVDLSSDRRLQRALENWQPRFLDWWKDMGPDGTLNYDVYLRTAISAEANGWANFGYVKMPDYRWGIFLAGQDPNRVIAYGDNKGKPAWQEVPGELRSTLRRLIVTQGDTEPASVEQQRLLGKTAPSLYDLRNVFQINCEEGRHLWAMVYLLHAYFGRDGREEAEMLLERHSGDPDKPRILGAFNEQTPDWLSFFMFTYFTDRDGKYQLASLAESGFDPLARSCRFMLIEEAHHMFVGESGVQRIVQRTCELMTLHDTNDVRALGAIDLPTLQKYLNFHFSVSLDLFGQEASTNAANYYTMGVKGRYLETRIEDDHLLG